MPPTGDRRPNIMHEVPKTGDRGPRADHGGPRLGGHVVDELCDYCGAGALAWRKCKLVCEKCGNIIKSCADL